MRAQCDTSTGAAPAAPPTAAAAPPARSASGARAQTSLAGPSGTLAMRAAESAAPRSAALIAIDASLVPAGAPRAPQAPPSARDHHTAASVPRPTPLGSIVDEHAGAVAPSLGASSNSSASSRAVAAPPAPSAPGAAAGAAEFSKSPARTLQCSSPPRWEAAALRDGRDTGRKQSTARSCDRTDPGPADDLDISATRVDRAGARQQQTAADDGVDVAMRAADAPTEPRPAVRSRPASAQPCATARRADKEPRASPLPLFLSPLLPNGVVDGMSMSDDDVLLAPAAAASPPRAACAPPTAPPPRDRAAEQEFDAAVDNITRARRSEESKDAAEERHARGVALLHGRLASMGAALAARPPPASKASASPVRLAPASVVDTNATKKSLLLLDRACHCLVVDHSLVAAAGPAAAARAASALAVALACKASSSSSSSATAVAVLALLTGAPLSAALAQDIATVYVSTSGMQQLHVNFHSLAALADALALCPLLARCGSALAQQNKWSRPCGPARAELPELVRMACVPVVALGAAPPTPQQLHQSITNLLDAHGFAFTRFWVKPPSKHLRVELSPQLVVSILPRRVATLGEAIARIHGVASLCGSVVHMHAPNHAQLSRCKHCDALGHRATACPKYLGHAVRLLTARPLSYAALAQLTLATGARDAYLAGGFDEHQPSRRVTLLYDADQSSVDLAAALDSLQELLMANPALLHAGSKPSVVRTEDRSRECHECGSITKPHACPFSTGFASTPASTLPGAPGAARQHAARTAASPLAAHGRPRAAMASEQQICSSWQRSGKCPRAESGQLCRFSHPADHVAQPQACYDFRAGRCTRSVCKYAHTHGTPALAQPAARHQPVVVLRDGAGVADHVPAPAIEQPAASSAAFSSAPTLQQQQQLRLSAMTDVAPPRRSAPAAADADADRRPFADTLYAARHADAESAAQADVLFSLGKRKLLVSPARDPRTRKAAARGNKKPTGASGTRRAAASSRSSSPASRSASPPTALSSQSFSLHANPFSSIAPDAVPSDTPSAASPGRIPASSAGRSHQRSPTRTPAASSLDRLMSPSKAARAPSTLPRASTTAASIAARATLAPSALRRRSSDVDVDDTPPAASLTSSPTAAAVVLGPHASSSLVDAPTRSASVGSLHSRLSAASISSAADAVDGDAAAPVRAASQRL